MARIPDMSKRPDVLLVYPPVMLEFQPTDPPFGCMYLAAALRRAGVGVEILDLNGLRWDEETTLDFLVRHAPSIVGFSGMTTVYSRVKRYAAHLRERAPETRMIGGGSFAGPRPEDALRHTALDVVCVGEADETIVPLVEALLRGEPLDDIAGIAFKDAEGGIRRTAERPRVADLDSLPFPAYDLVDMKMYLGNTGKRPSLARLCDRLGYPLEAVGNYFIMFTERGCPFTCTFCYRNFGRQTKRHSVDYVIRHIKYVNETFGANNIAFYDETFNTSKKWVLEFCRRAREELPSCFFWVGGARADRLDEETASAMRDAQFYEVSIGVESFDDRILTEMRKGFTAQTLIDAIELLKRHDLAPSVLAMLYGFPGDDEASLATTEAALRRLGIPAYFQFPLPFPGTLLFDEMERAGRLGDIDELMERMGDQMTQNLFMNLSRFSDDRLVAMVRDAERRHAAFLAGGDRGFWGNLTERAGLKRLFSLLGPGA